MKNIFNNPKQIFSITLVLLCVLSISSCSDSKESTTNQDEMSENNKNRFSQDLGSVMLDIQARHSKLYYAGINENWELASFTIQELGESFKSITRHHRSHDEVNINKLTNTLMIPTINELEKIVESKDIDSFSKGFNKLTISCNKCHSESNHDFIKIKTPIDGDFLNQDFSK